jgi:hypothetical protein
VSESDGRASGDRFARLWWAAPVTIVVIGAIGASIVVAPTLGRHASVPSGLSVPLHSTAVARPTPSVSPVAPRRDHPKTSPTSTPSAVSTTTPSTHIVVPEHPLVTSSADRYDDSGGHEPGDR